MQLREALVQIDTIQGHLARTETFRGYRSGTTAASGILGLAGASAQFWWLEKAGEDLIAWLGLWIAVAAGSLLVAGGEIGLRYLRSQSALARRATLLAVEQFLPCLVAGACLTGVIAVYASSAAWLLPGLWAVVFSLGIFASCRLLPGAIVWVGLYYLVSGLAAVALGRDHPFSPWAMVGTFGVGQLLCAAILYVTLERRHESG